MTISASFVMNMAILQGNVKKRTLEKQLIKDEDWNTVQKKGRKVSNKVSPPPVGSGSQIGNKVQVLSNLNEEAEEEGEIREEAKVEAKEDTPK